MSLNYIWIGVLNHFWVDEKEKVRIDFKTIEVIQNKF